MVVLHVMGEGDFPSEDDVKFALGLEFEWDPEAEDEEYGNGKEKNLGTFDSIREKRESRQAEPQAKTMLTQCLRLMWHKPSISTDTFDTIMLDDIDAATIRYLPDQDKTTPFDVNNTTWAEGWNSWSTAVMEAFDRLAKRRQGGVPLHARSRLLFWLHGLDTWSSMVPFPTRSFIVRIDEMFKPNALALAEVCHFVMS